MTQTTSRRVIKITGAEAIEIQDWISVEEPLEIRLCHDLSGFRQRISVTMRTPGHDTELAVGFLFTEDIISTYDEIDKVTAEENIVTVELANDTLPSLEKLRRNFYTTSSCGVCGKASIDAVSVKCDSIKASLRVDAGIIQSLPSKLVKKQRVFEQTGSLHASGLFDKHGALQLIREDVGRHNALDKVIGAMVMNNKTSLPENILLVSGRISFELVQKAARAGIPIVAAVGAPSSLAISLAEEMNMTLIGFVRDGKFSVYTSPERILT